MNTTIIPWLRRTVFFLSQIVLIFAFGCGPRPTPIVIIFPTATNTATEAPVVLPTETPTPAVTATPFVPKAVIRIFAHLPLSGDGIAAGTDMLRGAELAVQQLSGPLNAQGFQVELIPYDDQGTTQTAVANARGLVTDPDILCGVGHYDSDTTVAASNVYHEAGLAFVAPAATTPILTDRSFAEVNRIIARADGQGRAAAQFAVTQGYGTVMIISQRSEESLRNAEYFRTESGNLGIQWLGSAVTDITVDNRDRLIRQIVNAGPDLVYISSAAEQALPFLASLRAAGYNGSFLGTESLDDPARIREAGASLTQGGGFYYTISSPSPQYFPEAAAFVQDFNSRHGTNPRSLAARTYDATGICLKAIEEAAAAKGGLLPIRSEVARALRRLTDYKGITGTYSLNNQGDPDPVQYFVYQVVSVDEAVWDQNPIVASYAIAPP
jgi:branched-chain amino acid transport system substrate-binding protein